MDEPTLAEEVRRLADEMRRLADAQQNYVTKEILGLRLEALAKDLGDLEIKVALERARLDRMTQWFWSALIGPVIVGVILYFTLGKGT